MVATEYGIVAASQPLAARAGVQILERGGNAIDAAIGANATIGLMEPTGNGIGGDLFAIIYMAEGGELYGLNASGWAPKELTIEFLVSKNVETMPASTPSPFPESWPAGTRFAADSEHCPSLRSSHPRSTTRRTVFPYPK